MHKISEDDVELLKAAIQQGMDPDSQDFGDIMCDGLIGYTMLETAAGCGHVGFARFLIEKGANVNYQNPEGHTALKWAAWEGHIEMIHLLIDAGADMTICGGGDAGGPLHAAAQGGHVEAVRTLLQRGADPNIKDMDGAKVSYLQRTLFLEHRPEETIQILALLKAAGAKDEGSEFRYMP